MIKKCKLKRGTQFFQSNFSVKSFMELNFGNVIEEGLFKIEKNKKMISTENKKKQKEIESDDQVAVGSDPFTLEGCCFELALYLLQHKPVHK